MCATHVVMGSCRGCVGCIRWREGCNCVSVCAAGGQQMGELVVECARLLSVSCGYTGWGR